MIVTVPGKDMITVADADLENWSTEVVNKKVHLIKILLDDPTEDKMDFILSKYPHTNRFIIRDNIKFYNWFFRSYEKKFYVENIYNARIISFFKKNNKVLLNFDNLDYDTRKFALKNNVFKDILRNLEIIQLDDDTFTRKKDILSSWNGNVIID